MDKHLNEVEFSIFDTETTGLYPEAGDRIIEIAAIRFKADSSLDVFESLVNPQRPLCDSSQKINNITSKMLENAPPIEKVLPDFFNFVKGSYLCAYNASFDFSFLKNESKLINYIFPEDLIAVDILKMAKILLPNLAGYSLQNVANNLGIPTFSLHRALADVKVSLEVFKKLKELLLNKEITGIDSFLGLFAIDNFLENLKQQKVSQLKKAIDMGARLKIKYLSRTDAQLTEREIIPKEVTYSKKNCFLVAWCLLRNEERIFYIDGILHLEVI